MTKTYNNLTTSTEIDANATASHDDLASLSLWRGVVWQALRDLELYYYKGKKLGLEAYEWFFGEDKAQLKEICELGNLDVNQMIWMAKAVLEGTRRPRKLR